MQVQLPTIEPIDLHTVLDLGSEPPIASGTYRDVYRFPMREELVVKVLRGGFGLRADRPLRSFFNRRHARANYRFLFREYDAYLAARINWPPDVAPLPIAAPMWLQSTNLGLGMVVERIRGTGPGGRAWSLKELVEGGRFEVIHLNLLNTFIAQIYRSNIVTNDTNPSNLLLDETSKQPRFVLVDGFGDATLLRAKNVSDWLRDRQRSRRFATLAVFVGGHWDPVQRKI